MGFFVLPIGIIPFCPDACTRNGMGLVSQPNFAG